MPFQNCYMMLFFVKVGYLFFYMVHFNKHILFEIMVSCFVWNTLYLVADFSLILTLLCSLSPLFFCVLQRAGIHNPLGPSD